MLERWHESGYSTGLNEHCATIAEPDGLPADPVFLEGKGLRTPQTADPEGGRSPCAHEFLGEPLVAFRTPDSRRATPGLDATNCRFSAQASES